MVDAYVEALLRERAGYARDPRFAHRVGPVDDELARLGFGVDDGKLVELAKVEKKRPPRERAVHKAPERAVDDE